MNVYVASDHAGFIKKNQLVERLAKHYAVVDLGPSQINLEDDYPLFAEEVADSVVEDPGSFGVVVCRSGEGMEIAANKVDGVRAALVWNKHLAYETRSDNDSNVLSLPSGELSVDEMYEIAKEFLSTPFSQAPRQKRRLKEIKNIEDQQ